MNRCVTSLDDASYQGSMIQFIGNGSSDMSNLQQWAKYMSTSVLVESRWLSSQVVDSLGEMQHDWISVLREEWEIQISSLSNRSDRRDRSPDQFDQTVREFVRLKSYQPVTVLQQTYWAYTCCVPIAGLGRVRLVASFNNVEQQEDRIIFVTNRLDWSPRTIMTQWFQGNPPRSPQPERSKPHPQPLLVTFG